MYPSTQWEAVRTCWSVMRTPPQNWPFPWRSSAAIHGHSPLSAGLPPSIRADLLGLLLPGDMIGFVFRHIYRKKNRYDFTKIQIATLPLILSTLYVFLDISVLFRMNSLKKYFIICSNKSRITTVFLPHHRRRPAGLIADGVGRPALTSPDSLKSSSESVSSIPALLENINFKFNNLF